MSEFAEGSEPEIVPAAHGVGDRKEYYNKWDRFAVEQDDQITADEEVAKRLEDERKSKEPLSEAQRKDLEKREALKEAKKQWDGVRAGEEAKKAVVTGENSLQDRTIRAEDMGEKQVLVLKDNTDCVYDIPSDTSLIKFFIEDCKGCTIRLHCSLKTSFVEISHCESVVLIVSTHPAHTIQVDMSENIRVYYHKNAMSEDSKLYHSSVRGLKVEYDILNTGKDTKSQELDDFELAKLNPQIAPKDQQYVTAFVEASNDFVTDLVLRDARGHPTTQRELDERRRIMEANALKSGIDITSDIVQKAIREYDPLSPEQRGKQHKDEGNTAFKAADYGQASVHYTQAIEALTSVLGARTKELSELLCSCYSNRSACCLKLGDHANALQDAEACLELNPDHVKAVFRKGMALHAMKRYREACPVLGKALKLNPGDKSISTALTFAERRAAAEGVRK